MMMVLTGANSSTVRSPATDKALIRSRQQDASIGGKNQDPTATGPSTTPAMADANAWRHYAGDNRPVAVKQKV